MELGPGSQEPGAPGAALSHELRPLCSTKSDTGFKAQGAPGCERDPPQSSGDGGHLVPPSHETEKNMRFKEEK